MRCEGVRCEGCKDVRGVRGVRYEGVRGEVCG